MLQLQLNGSIDPLVVRGGILNAVISNNVRL